MWKVFFFFNLRHLSEHYLNFLNFDPSQCYTLDLPVNFKKNSFKNKL